jgi:hypothetical protein
MVTECSYYGFRDSFCTVTETFCLQKIIETDNNNTLKLSDKTILLRNYSYNYKNFTYLNGMRPGCPSRKIWSTGQGRRNGIRQSLRYAGGVDGRHPISVQ